MFLAVSEPQRLGGVLGVLEGPGDPGVPGLGPNFPPCRQNLILASLSEHKIPPSSSHKKRALPGATIHYKQKNSLKNERYLNLSNFNNRNAITKKVVIS